MNRSIIIGIALICVSFGTNAQDMQSSASLIEQLQSTSPEVRTKASTYIYGGGLDDARVYAAVKNAIDVNGSDLTSKSPGAQQQEIAWHAKALASSANMEYMPLLEALSESKARTVAKHAKRSVTLLRETSSNGRPFLGSSRVTEIFEGQRANCELMHQNRCSTIGRQERCRDWHKEQAAQIGANSIMLLRENGSAFKRTSMANYYKCSDDELASPELIAVNINAQESNFPSYIAELKELASLRDDGIITEAEFQEKKAEILSRE